MAHRRLQGRQASSTAAGTSTLSRPRQPTTTLALSTTFTPPASCTRNDLTILPSPGFLIWANEPVPVANTTLSDCYPSEFLQSYTSVSSGKLGSSVAPVMSPLVCPQNFCVQWVQEKYIVCCPSEFEFTPPETTLIESRPGYGGTCYSPFTMGVTVTAKAYDIDGATRFEPWVASLTSMNAYAHPIDGFAESAPSAGCRAPLSMSQSSNLTSTRTGSALSASEAPSDTAALATKSGKTSSGTIAGAVVGAVAGLALIVALIIFLLRRRRRQPQATEEDIPQIDGTAAPGAEKDGKVIVGEIDSGKPAVELAGHSEKYAHVHEMGAGDAHEMPAGAEMDPTHRRPELDPSDHTKSVTS